MTTSRSRRSNRLRLRPTPSILPWALSLGLCLAVSPMAVGATDSLPSGDEIAQRVNDREDGVAVERTLTIELTDRRGKTRRQTTRGLRKTEADVKRSVLFYQSPTNVKDTAFLTYDYVDAGQEDDQWLYLPALRKVRRISASDRGDYFLGTDFTYEEIKKETKVALEDYDRETLRTEEVDGRLCYVIEAVPVDEGTARELGHSKQRSWIDAELWMARKVETWDLAGNPLKTVHIRDIVEIDGIWTALRLEAENHKTGHSTVFSFSDVAYHDDLDDELFSDRALRRGQ